jgi:hypothetical protein
MIGLIVLWLLIYDYKEYSKLALFVGLCFLLIGVALGIGAANGNMSYETLYHELEGPLFENHISEGFYYGSSTFQRFVLRIVVGLVILSNVLFIMFLFVFVLLGCKLGIFLYGLVGLYAIDILEVVACGYLGFTISYLLVICRRFLLDRLSKRNKYKLRLV